MEESAPSLVRLELTEADDIDEVIIAFRKDGELVELAGHAPPVVAELKKP